MAGGFFLMSCLFLVSASATVHSAPTASPLAEDIQKATLEKLHTIEGGLAVLAACQHQKSVTGAGLGAVVAQMFDAFLSTKTQLQATQTELQASKAELQSQLQNIQKELQTIRTEPQTTQTQLQTTQTQLQTTQTQHQTTQTQLQTPQTELQAIKTELQDSKAELQSQLQNVQTELQTIQTDLQTTQTERQSIQTQLQTTQTELQSTQTELQNIQTQLQTTQAVLQTTQTELQTIQTDLQTTQTERQSIQTQLQTTQTELQSTQTELQNIQTQLQTTQAVLQTTQTKLQTTQTELQANQTELHSQLQNVQTDLTNRTPLLNTDPGSTFVRWGRTSCPLNTTLVYDGVAGGKHWQEKGSGTNRLCLTRTPQYDDTPDAEWFGLLHGSEYQFIRRGYEITLPTSLPCSVCRAPQATTIMMAATLTCPLGWTAQYRGHLTAARKDQNAAEYVCLDEISEDSGIRVKGTYLWNYFYLIRTACASLPCPPYQDGKIVTCVVCSK